MLGKVSVPGLILVSFLNCSQVYFRCVCARSGIWGMVFLRVCALSCGCLPVAGLTPSIGFQVRPGTASTSLVLPFSLLLLHSALQCLPGKDHQVVTRRAGSTPALPTPRLLAPLQGLCLRCTTVAVLWITRTSCTVSPTSFGFPEHSWFLVVCWLSFPRVLVCRFTGLGLLDVVHENLRLSSYAEAGELYAFIDGHEERTLGDFLSSYRAVHAGSSREGTVPEAMSAMISPEFFFFARLMWVSWLTN